MSGRDGGNFDCMGKVVVDDAPFAIMQKSSQTVFKGLTSSP